MFLKNKGTPKKEDKVSLKQDIEALRLDIEKVEKEIADLKSEKYTIFNCFSIPNFHLSSLDSA